MTKLSSLVGFGAGGGSSEDNREFKNWTDFVGQISATGQSVTIGQRTRTVNGVTYNRQVSSGSFTVPSGVSKVRITCVGAGGAGGCYASTYYGGAGGGGGCFVSAEYDVTAGETLNITSGTGGASRQDQGYGGNGGTSSVTDAQTGGSRIAVSAAGGSGGYYSSTVGAGGASHSASGSNIIASTTVGGHGGSGGGGSPNAFGFGPEGYGAGGGGAAGSYLGSGGTGATVAQGGYSYGSGGGGGVGGNGGQGSHSQGVGSVTSNYPCHGGGGGGTAGHGDNAAYNQLTEFSQGGAGRFSSNKSVDFDDGTNEVYGESIVNWSSANSVELSKSINGSRYGDGEATGPLLYNLSNGIFRGTNPGTTYINRGSSGPGGSLGQYDMFDTGGGSGTGVPATGTSPKSFNGVLGRLWGGGGGGAPTQDNTFGHYNHSGGDGGTGGGGGGAGGSRQNYNSGTLTPATYTSWDWANLAFRTDDSAWNTNGYKINGMGGNGGALGGGGGGVYYGFAGSGGIGGGGGGGGGHYQGSSGRQRSGMGGPGYVLIEW